jgi:Cdc6-like AAA superfamily ATPase
LNSAECQDWLKADNQTLFCPGIPGAGKTFITSIVIDYLQTNYKSSGVAYLYCDIGQQGQQAPETLLGSILKQLVSNRSPLPKEVKSLYEQHKGKRSRPELIEISKVLQSVISPDSRTFILIDALDECQNHDSCRDILLSEIFTLQVKTRLNIFATSRPQEVEAKFSGSIICEIIAIDNDIEAYLDDKILLWEKSHERDLDNIRDMIKRK